MKWKMGSEQETQMASGKLRWVGGCVVRIDLPSGHTARVGFLLLSLHLWRKGGPIPTPVARAGFAVVTVFL